MAVKFDISQIPSGADILEATYSMFLFWGDTAQQGDPNVCSLFTISKHWIDTEVTWNNADSNTAWENTDPDTKFYNPITGDTSITPGGCFLTRENKLIAQYAKIHDWENYDVTDIVKKIHKNQIANYGFMIKQFVCIKTTRGRDPKLRYNWGKSYRSSEYEEVEKRPKLTVKYEQTSINPTNLTSTLNNDIVIKKNGENLKIFIPFENNYTVLFSDLKGSQVYTFEGNQNQWYYIVTENFSNKMYIVSVKLNKKTLYSKFLFVT